MDKGPFSRIRRREGVGGVEVKWRKSPRCVWVKRTGGWGRWMGGMRVNGLDGWGHRLSRRVKGWMGYGLGGWVDWEWGGWVGLCG